MLTDRIRLGTILSLFFLVLFSVVLIYGWEWPYIAKVLPVYVVGIPGIVLCLIQLYRDQTGREKQGGTSSGGIEVDEVFHEGLDKETEIRRTLAFFAWFAAGALAIWLLGITVAIPSLVLAYTFFEGGEKWWVAVLLAVGAFLFLWGVFEYLIDSEWPPGILTEILFSWY